MFIINPNKVTSNEDSVKYTKKIFNLFEEEVIIIDGYIVSDITEY